MEVPLPVVISLAVPTGFGLSTIIFFLTSIIFSQNLFHLFVNMAIIGVVSLILFLVAIKLRMKFKRMLKICKYDPIVFAGYAAVAFYIVFKTYLRHARTFPLTMEPFIHEEISLQSSFLVGTNSPKLNVFHLKHPNYAGGTCVSRWLTALHAVMLRIGKANLKHAISVPSFIEMMSYLVSMFYFTKEFSVPYPISIIAPFIAINVAGFGFFGFLNSGVRFSRLNDYVTDTAMGHSSRFHPLLNIYLGSLPTVYALSLLGPIFYLVLKIAKKGMKLDKKTAIFIGFISGILLLPAQHQAYFSLAAYFGFFVFINMLFGRSNPYFALIAIGFAVGSAIHVPRIMNKEFISNLFGKEAPWSRLYKRGVLFPAVDFWMGTYGTFQVVLLIGFFLLERSEKLVFLPSVFCFVIFTFWKLTPSCEYNSVPIFCVFIIVAGPIYCVIWWRLALLAKTVELKGAILMIGFICGVINCTSSILGIFKQWKTSKQSWGEIEERTADWIVKHTSRDAVFHVPRIEMEPVSLLAGRQVFLESIPIMRNVGFDSEEREDMYRNITHANLEGFENYVNYIVKMVSMVNDANEVKLSDNWDPVYTNREYEIYEYKK